MAYRTKPKPPHTPAQPALRSDLHPPTRSDPGSRVDVFFPDRFALDITLTLPPGAGPDLSTKLDHILAQLSALHAQEKTFMADQTVRLDKLDAATTKLAAVLQELRDAAVNGMSPADAARFDATIATLEAMGADPANPLPEVPAEPA